MVTAGPHTRVTVDKHVLAQHELATHCSISKTRTIRWVEYQSVVSIFNQ